MQYEGVITIQAPREKVWDYLTSPEFVASCAPGVQSVEVVIPDKHFKAITDVGFGSTRVRFESDIKWLELYDGRYARMSAHGKTPGSGIDVVSEMRLTTCAGATNLEWKADITVVGQLASTAARLMSGITRNLTTAFFDCMKGKIES